MITTLNAPNLDTLLMKASEEKTLILEFLKKEGLQPPQLTLLPQDASKRYYYRVEGENVLIMVANSTQKPEQFIKISKILNTLGITAPRVHAKSGDFYLIDDFGNNTYGRALSANNAMALYEKATDVLIHIVRHIQSAPEGIPLYTPEIIAEELLLFPQWYPQNAPEHAMKPSAIQDFTQLWQTYLQNIKGPQTLSLRDYHIDNLFYFPEKKGIQQVGVIDFQDGVFAPAPLDLVSLTEDARKDVSHDIRRHVTQKFINAFDLEHHEALLLDAKIIDLARQLRILGVFSRLEKHYNKPHYMIHLPRLEGYVKNHLKDPFFKDFSNWCRVHGFFQD